jgi:type IV pilus assembly protein PilE
MRSKAFGFTLLELMIVVVVIAILAALAYPSYMEYLRKGRRADAFRAVGQYQLNMERWRAENPSFAACTPTPCGSGTYPATPASDYYTFTRSNEGASTYKIVAAPTSGTAQANDRCGNLTVDYDPVNNKIGKPSWANTSCNN